MAQLRALAERRAGTEDETETETVNEYLEVWLRSKDGRVAASTSDQYAGAPASRGPSDRCRALCDLTPEMLDKWVAA